ncbi:uncharacterized protein METZ01_LOCUS198010, partial [marine metagenome]
SCAWRTSRILTLGRRSSRCLRSIGAGIWIGGAGRRV